METLEAFLAGDRLDDVAIYINDQYLSENHMLATEGEDVENGVVLVVPGDEGRTAFSQGTGIDPMEFAGTAMGKKGHIEPDLAGGECPAIEADDDPADHVIEFVFAFAEGQNEEVGGLYEDGDVIHAYAHCSCGVNFSQKWIAGSRQ